MAQALLEIFDETLQKWVIAIGPDGRPIVGDPATGEGWECCCGGGGEPNPCCLTARWRRCVDGSFVTVTNFGSEAIYIVEATRTTRVDRTDRVYNETQNYREVTRYFGVLQPNGQCWFYQQCVELMNRIVRVWEFGQGHTNGEVEVVEDTQQCANPNPVRMGSNGIGGSCYYSVQTGTGFGCSGSYGSVFQTLWVWNIQCNDSGTDGFSVTGTEGIRVVEGASIVELSSIQYSKSLVPTQPCGSGSLTGPGSRPLEPGIADFLRRQQGCVGCGG